MNLTYKLRKQKPDKVILYFPIGVREPMTIDWSLTSTKEAMRIIRTVQWTSCEAFVGESMLFVVSRDEVDDLDDDMDEEVQSTPRTKAVNLDPDGLTDSWQVSPERWLRLLITAQQSSTAHMETTIAVILDTMKENNSRAQELLDQSHNMLVTQGEHIERLLDQVAQERPDEEKENWGEKIEQIVEGLAPVVVPLLMKLGSQTPAPTPPQIEDPTGKKKRGA